MEPTIEQIEQMEAMEKQYRQDMKDIEELEEMFVDDEIEAPKIIDPNADVEDPEEPEDPNVQEESPEPESPRAEPGTFLHWLACQNERKDPIGDLARDYINDITHNTVFYRNYSEFSNYLNAIWADDCVLDALLFAKIEFDDFEEEEATYRDEQFMLKVMKEKHVGC